MERINKKGGFEIIPREKKDDAWIIREPKSIPKTLESEKWFCFVLFCLLQYVDGALKLRAINSTEFLDFSRREEEEKRSKNRGKC